MRLLLDTHVFLWWLADAKALPPAARKKIVEADAVYVSAASLWEAVIKIGIGRLKADPGALSRGVVDSGFVHLPVTSEHTVALSRLPALHKDPFDRILVAQAVTEPLHFLTADRTLAAYSSLVVPIV